MLFLLIVFDCALDRHDFRVQVIQLFFQVMVAAFEITGAPWIIALWWLSVKIHRRTWHDIEFRISFIVLFGLHPQEHDIDEVRNAFDLAWADAGALGRRDIRLRSIVDAFGLEKVRAMRPIVCQLSVLLLQLVDTIVADDIGYFG